MEAYLKKCCRILMGPSIFNTFVGCNNAATHFAFVEGANRVNGYCDMCWPDFRESERIKELNKEEVFVANILME